jgi:hypothetical protein
VVTIKSGASGTIDLISITGQKILTRKIDGNIENKLELAGIAKGVYIVRFNGKQNNQLTRKLILN